MDEERQAWGAGKVSCVGRKAPRPGGFSIAPQLLASGFCRPTLRGARDPSAQAALSVQSCLESHVLEKPGSWS